MIVSIKEGLGEYDTPNRIKWSSVLKVDIDEKSVPVETLSDDAAEAIMGALSATTTYGRIESVVGYIYGGHGLIHWKLRVNVRINGERVAFDDLSHREKQAIIEAVKHSLFYDRQNARGEFLTNGLHIYYDGIPCIDSRQM